MTNTIINVRGASSSQTHFIFLSSHVCQLVLAVVVCFFTEAVLVDILLCCY